MSEGRTRSSLRGLNRRDATTNGWTRYVPNGRWGLRADYRFIALRGKDRGAAFLARDDRYGHRVYGGVVIDAVR